MLRNFLLALVWIAAVLVVVGFLGSLHRAADSIAIVRPMLGIVCLLGVILGRALWDRAVFAAITLLAVSTTAVSFLPQPAGGDLRVYSKNLWFANAEVQTVAADIEAADVDVVMLQEVSDKNRSILGLLEPSFPHQHLCRFSGWSGIALASRHPFAGDPECSSWRAVLAAPVVVDGQRVWTVSAHVPWPWPHDSVQNEQAAEDVLSKLEGPIVIAGDFNIVPWSGRIERTAALTGTQLAGPARPTLYLRNIPLPIDLVLAPGGGAMEVRPNLGSDHAGVVADVALWNTVDRWQSLAELLLRDFGS
ncbi:endonuclease/exonuclease/phosphatase family protein [Parasedimentitalea huanghaiensis]|uniref:Endonuclease/exonuclease/phosphatase domain-containing protein n=1 Tax=Parasedimentitalea huanghaiensis TaxID=2682100 RepID=A0A6L6WE24_9RHOB|nr:endonuclease/exonuclease/phosphatase family protein [Zongyanglinia huanghaiensis]MVO16133.1 hypothetical protein [Zongyanglinia huanghaiensis]